jgi:hypothetical protein
MSGNNLETIPIVLATTLGTDSWDLNLPLDVPVTSIIQKLIVTADLPFREQDDSGFRIPYRLMWKERGRYLIEGETLRRAEVGPGHTLVMAHEARAGALADVPFEVTA